MRPVRFEKVTFGYPCYRHYCASPKVLDCTSFELAPGNVYVMSGPNGSGKSTIVKLMAGLLRPDAGHITEGGDDLSGLSLPETGRRVGLVMQEPARQLITDSAVEEVMFGLLNSGMGRVIAEATAKSLLRRLGLSGTEEKFPQRMSKGEQIRLALASVLALKPDWLVMDESLPSLDPESKDLTVNMLTEAVAQGHGVVIVSHSDEALRIPRARRMLLEKGGAVLVG